MRDHEILLAHKIGEINTFLPGGHLKQGEFAARVLERELSEELGVDADVGDFVGIIEHKFRDERGRNYEEINLIFETHIPDQEVISNEYHLEFIWADINNLEEQTLHPSSLPPLLREWLTEGKPFHHAQRE
jgi:8-oxo-dGTP pyrophosphatase MutT (NUDIX family)